jgi:hypothetical protein
MTAPLGLSTSGAGNGGRSNDDSGPDENFSAALANAVHEHFDDHFRRTRERSSGVLPVETAAVVARPDRDDPPDSADSDRPVAHHAVQGKLVKAMLDGAGEIVGALDDLAAGAANGRTVLTFGSRRGTSTDSGAAV